MKNNSENKNTKLARQISDLLNNPDCPTNLYNAIADELTFFSNFIDFQSLDMIEKSLEAYQEKGDNQESDISRENGISVII